MVATSTLFDLVVHHCPTSLVIHNVDIDYSYMRMCYDALAIALVDLPANLGTTSTSSAF